MIGLVLDRRYQIIEVLGQGGFGYTFIAKDTKRPGHPICVVKQLKPSFSEPGLLYKARDLFNREAETLQNLGENPQIPRLLAYFEDSEEFYLVQEYIAGETLSQELISGQSLTEAQVIIIIKELLQILEFVHSHQVIHRDIKPSNIIRRKVDDKLVLIDFGAVKTITTEGKQRTIVIGTPGYISIEQFNGQPNFCSDIYAVGMIGIQALTGNKPQPYVGGGFATDTQENILWQQSAQVSDRLATILTKMVRNNYRERYQSATEALQAIYNLENIINATTLITKKTPTKLPKSIKKMLGYSAFVIATLFAIVTTLKLWQGNSSSAKLPLNGKLAQGVLDSQDICEVLLEVLLENIYCNQYNFQGKKGQQVTIEMSSNDFDPYLVLRAPDGNKLAVNGDISPQDWNARIAIALPTNGTYLLMARTSTAGESGSYSIQIKVK